MAGRNRINIANIEERVENDNIRKQYGRQFHERSDTEVSEQVSYLQLLKLSEVAEIEAPFNQTKLFVLGQQNSGKEAVLSALFNIDMKEDLTSGEMQPIVLGNYYSDSFKDRPSTKEGVKMEVWNYSWKAVYNYLQNLYMTSHTLYLFVFNMQKLTSDDPKVQIECLSYLKNILNSKKLQAPVGAPVLLVGTHGPDFSEEDINHCRQMLATEVLQGNNFGVSPMRAGVNCANLCCEKGGNDLDDLRERIHNLLKAKAYVTQPVPTILMKAEALLKGSKKQYMRYSEVRRKFVRLGIKDDDVCEILLKIMAERGMITFLYQYERLRKFVIIDPDWLKLACGIPIFKYGKHKMLDHDIDDDRVVADFNIFVFQRVLSKHLLVHILSRMGYKEEVHDYIVDLMTSTCMVALYLFDNVESFLTPTFFDNLQGQTSTYSGKDIINENDYQGPYFVIDFSGRHTSKVVRGKQQQYASFMPFSFFEKLVSLSIQLSASFGQGIQPVTRFRKARLSFGAEVDFMLSVIEDSGGRPLKIKVSTFTGTSQSKANDLLERIFSMARGIRKDFYPGVPGKSELVLALLVPPANDAIDKLTDYEEIQTAIARNVRVIPNFTVPGFLETKEFERWRRDGQALQVGSTVSYVPKEANGLYPLSKGKAQHCFLSYKETSALKIVQRQLNDLKRLGYVCWLNKEYKGNLTLDVYKNEVKKSMCFILVLSADVFASHIILEELRTAIAHKVPIFFLHHPDTDKLGYWTFTQYVSSCPSDLRHLFEEIESIPLHRRFYLQEATTHKLVRKIRKVVNINQK